MLQGSPPKFLQPSLQPTLSNLQKSCSNLADATGRAVGLSQSAQQTLNSADQLLRRTKDDLVPDVQRQLGMLSIILKCLSVVAALACLDWLVAFVSRTALASLYLLRLMGLPSLSATGICCR